MLTVLLVLFVLAAFAWILPLAISPLNPNAANVYGSFDRRKTMFDGQALTDVAVYSGGKDMRGALFNEVRINLTAAAASAGIVVTIEDSDDGVTFLTTGLETSALDVTGVTSLAISKNLRRFVRLKAVAASGKTGTVSAWLPFATPRGGLPGGARTT